MRFSIIIALALSALTSYSQDANLPTYLQDGAQITGSLADCHDVENGTHKQYVLLTVTNENQLPITVSFKKNMWYNGTCLSCDSQSDEYNVSVDVPANSFLAGRCSENSSLRIFSKMLNLDKVRKLTNYELIDLNINGDE